MDATQLITSKGFACENYYVTTEDGYILNLLRIPHGRYMSQSTQDKRPVVYIQHGLLGSAADFLLNPVNESLGFLLADAGADVWLGNSRGNIYSMKHMHLDEKQAAFWQFSWDEMAKYDLPAMIKFITNKTGVSKIYYIGHSQGTTIAFAGLSENKDLAKHIKHVIAMSPIARVGHIKSPVHDIAHFTHEMYVFCRILRGDHGEFGVFDKKQHNMLTGMCATYGWKTCEDLVFLLGGKDSESFNITRFPVYTAHLPAGTSFNNIHHWAQAYLSKKFQKFDFKAGNYLKYNQTTPPEYDVTKIKVPVTMFRGGNDLLISDKDINWLIQQLPVTHVINIARYNHVDPLVGIDAPDLLYKDIFKIIFS